MISKSLDSILKRLHALPVRVETPEDRSQWCEALVSDRLKDLVGSRAAETLQSIKPTRMLAAAQAWDTSPSWCLLLYGGVGCGKSVAAAWLAQRALMMLASVAWLRAPQAALMGLYDAEARARARQARNAALLVVDDLGAEFSSEAWRGWLEDILSARHTNGDRTVLTTNLDPAAFRARVGARLGDRIREGTVFGSDEPSMRIKGDR